MKYFLSFASVFLLLLCFDCPHAYSEGFTWKKSPIDIDGLKGYQYYMKIAEADCKINAFESERLEIFTEDFSSPSSSPGAHQIIVIEKKGSILNIKSKVKNKDGSIYLEDGGYDIFCKKFRAYSLDLPPDVRKLFRGYCGIE